MDDDDSLLQAALDRIQELVSERNELEAFVATYRKLKARSSPHRVEQLVAPVAATAPQSSSTVVIVDAAMNALAKRGGPMKLVELHDAIVSQGVQIGGKNPKNNLGAKLSAEPRLVTHKELGWWFASDPVPAKFRLDDDAENERGSATDVAEPLHSNGAAVSPA